MDLILSNFVQTSGSITRNRNKETKREVVQDTLLIIKYFQKFEEQNSYNSQVEKDYFNKKYTLCTVTIFNLLIKYNMPVSEPGKIKRELVNDNLFILNYEGLIGKKDLFRKFLKYSFPAYIFILALKNRIN